MDDFMFEEQSMYIPNKSFEIKNNSRDKQSQISDSYS